MNGTVQLEHSQVPKYSIVVPTLNRASCLDACLSSLGCQISPPTYEVVVIYDGSSDNTPCIVRQHVKTHPTIFKPIRQEHKGLAAAKNLGIVSALGQTIVFLDDDTVVPPEFLRGVDAILAHGNVDALGFSDLPRTHDPYLASSIRHLENFSRRFLIKDLAGRLKGGFLVVKRDVFTRVGGFDESRTYYMAEDTDFNYRMARARIKMMVTDAVYVYHRSPTFMEFTKRSFSTLLGPRMLDVPKPISYYRVDLGLILLLSLILVPVLRADWAYLAWILLVALSGLLAFSLLVSLTAAGTPLYGPGILLVAATRLFFILSYSIRFVIERTSQVVRAVIGPSSAR